MIYWNDPEPMKSGGESQTSTCGRFRLYKSVLGGWSVGYRANEFTPWKPIDPHHGGQTRWHQSRKMALQVVESFAKQYNGRPLPIPKGATTVSVTREKPVLASPVSSPSNSRRPIMSENESTTTVEESAAVADAPIKGARKKRSAKKVAAKATKTATKGTKVSPKKKAAAKGTKAVKGAKKKAKAKPSANGKVNRVTSSDKSVGERQLMVVKAMRQLKAGRAAPIDADQIAAKCGLTRFDVYGCLYHTHHLQTEGFVEQRKDEGQRKLRYFLTAKGLKASDSTITGE